MRKRTDARAASFPRPGKTIGKFEMGLFGLFAKQDINEGVKAAKATPGAKLIDVRTEEEFSTGRIPGSINIPLQDISAVSGVIPDKNAPLFLYCQSGARSGNAVRYLKSMGYTNVSNLGGLYAWRGGIER
jgi:phage shock protein E